MGGLHIGFIRNNNEVSSIFSLLLVTFSITKSVTIVFRSISISFPNILFKFLILKFQLHCQKPLPS